MRTSIFVMLASLVAAPVAATPAPRESSPAHRAIHHRTLAMRAEAPVPATIFPGWGPWPYPLNYHRTDGLSRNPEDCLRYGCIGSN
jgi:hypothetical protein